MAHRRSKISLSTIVLGLGAILVASATMAVLFSVPSAWLLMLLLGNLGHPVGFLGALPGGLLIGTLASRVSVTRE